MEKLISQLANLGIVSPAKIYHNLSFEELYQHETMEHLTGFEKAYHTKSGALSVDTGIFTGRSPKDKYVVVDDETRNNVWWNIPGKKSSDNKPITTEAWEHLKKISQEQLSNKNLYVMDLWCGANKDTRLSIRFITEVAWQAHFVKNMFIRPPQEDLENFVPDFVVFNSCKAVNPDWKEMGMNSEVYIAFNLTEKMALIGGSWYGGEMKKGIFSVMNYFLPLRGIASMHCSANQGKNGETAIFFGLSGTGKTTLSTDPNRALIGDDEHGWDDNGIFNFEGGCYAKCINLSEANEPDIYHAIKRDALLENLVIEDEKIIFESAAKTENTRVSYPIYHIDNIVKPESKGAHPCRVIFLSADAFGVLPPVSILSKEQTMYYFLSGYTAKLAGTERGIVEPTPTFSSCFGAAFLMLHPTKYAEVLAKRLEENQATAYLVNTGWIGGGYNSGGKRISIKDTRTIISAILNGELITCETEIVKPFNLTIPQSINGIDPLILNPENSWQDKMAFKETANKLASYFIENFKTFTDNENGKKLVPFGPQL